jgi:hypothetical protein
MHELIINQPTMSCCGRPRGECRCGGAPDDTDLLPPPREPLVENAAVGVTDPDPDGPLLMDCGADPHAGEKQPGLAANAADEDDLLLLPDTLREVLASRTVRPSGAAGK